MLSGPLNNSQQVFSLTASLIVPPLALSNTAKIESHTDRAQLDETLRQLVNDFVIQGSAVQRVGVTNDGKRLRDSLRLAGNRLKPAGRTVDEIVFSL